MSTNEKQPLHPVTATVRAGIDTDQQYGAVVPPLHLSSTYTFAGFNTKRQFDYGRTSNPTRSQLGDALATLEGGVACTVTGSGMGAVSAVLATLPAKAKVVATHDLYGGTWRLLNALQQQGKLSVDFVNLADSAALEAALADAPELVWLETPSNPLLRLTDIAAVAEQAHAVGARLCVDNTLLSPGWQNPIAFGADLVVHSTTKYINGHSDVVGGAVVSADADLAEQIHWWTNCLGLNPGPFDAMLTLRGLRTLAVRLAQHEANAHQIAGKLAQSVDQVYYPGLESHPDHELAIKQQKGFGGMVSFECPGGRAGAQAFLEGLEVLSLAQSLGGVESLVSHPATMTHASMSAEARAAAGISDALIRISVGIEHVDDLIADIQHGLGRAEEVARCS